MEIPTGLMAGEEWEAVRRMQGREVKAALVEWLLGASEWLTRYDLTFEGLAHPERAEKAVRRFLGKVAPGALAVVGYERQERGAVHAHGLSDQEMDYPKAEEEWNRIGGWCRVEAVDSQEAAMAYAVKHAIKDLDVEMVRIVPVITTEWALFRGKVRPRKRVEYVDVLKGGVRVDG